MITRIGISVIGNLLIALADSDEGPDDFPAHVKSSLIGTSVTIPIKNGKLVCVLLLWFVCGGRRRRTVEGVSLPQL